MSAPRFDTQRIQRDTWALPGITIRVSSDAGGMTVKSGEESVDITYKEATRFELRMESTTP